jgi:hypothetical protein
MEQSKFGKTLGRHMNANGMNADKPARLVLPIIAKSTTSARNRHCVGGIPMLNGLLNMNLPRSRTVNTGPI